MKLSLTEARAYAITAQGFATPPPTVRKLAERLGVIQIDSVNVLVRSHYLPAFSRMGSYDRSQLDKLSHKAPRALFEYWGHEASLLPVAMQPLFRWRMARATEHAWRNVRLIAKKQPSLLDDVLAIVREKGPLTAREIDVGEAKKRKGWWAWSEAKTAIEFLFWSGQVTSAARVGFERLYDLPERVIPAPILARATPPEDEAHRELVEIAARAMGVASEADLRDYYRLPVAGARKAVADLVEDGALVPVTVEGWKKPAYLHRKAQAKAFAGAALLSPFDNLIWFRDRTERLFGMRYRIEIYTPEPKRVHGYYVLPVLAGDALIARVDLKADRAASALRVQAAHAEPGVAKAKAAKTVAGCLSRMASWLGLERVEVMPKGDLAAALKRAGTDRASQT